MSVRASYFSGPLAVALAVVGPACGGDSASGFGTDGGGGGSSGFGGSNGHGNQDSGLQLGVDSGTGEGGTTTVTIYANTDTELYSLDPVSNMVTRIGPFAGTGGSAYDSTVTDCAVNAEGQVYVNTETAVYLATLPTTLPGTVNLSKVSTIAGSSDQSFYALAFAPPGFLGSGETLVGGDGNGVLWSIDTSTGATQNLGSFGPVPDRSDKVYALSGDVVFYTNAMGSPTGLATIRACDSSGSDCTEGDDYLAGIDMTALSTAYTSHSAASTLLGGIYGWTSTSVGPGTGYGELFGLGAWGNSVYAFERAESSSPPNLILIDTTSGSGSIISSSFGFSSGGWSGAGVTTKTTVTVAPPPPPPK